MSSKYLLNFTIGPVQEFIEQSRKTRDLLASSRLLSCLTAEAIKSIEKAGSVRIILPHSNTGSLSGFVSMPNYFMAWVEGKEHDDVKKLANEAGETAQKKWEEIAKGIKGRINGKLSGWDALWDEQIKGAFQCYWVAKSFDSNTTNQAANKEISYLMRLRKKTRTFGPSQGGRIDKCHICGKREILGPLPSEDDIKNGNLKQHRENIREFWKPLAEKFIVKGKGERLCAVCLTKRMIEDKAVLGVDELGIKSTSDIASIIWKNKVCTNSELSDKRDRLLQSIVQIEEALGARQPSTFNDIDGRWFYLESHTEQRIESDYGKSIGGELLKKSQVNLSELYKKAGAPTKYYAMLMMDGDNIGKAFSKCSDLKKLSNQLHQLGDGFADHIKENNGMPVYSGGDDLLGLLPLNSALSVSQNLRNDFVSKLIAEKITASAGLVITHHLDPLQRALATAREAVEKAKDYSDKKDAFTICVLIRCGTMITCTLPWVLGDNLSAVDVLQHLTKLLQNGLSLAFIYEFESALPAFNPDGRNRQSSLPPNAIVAEINRMLKRHKRPEVTIDNLAEELVRVLNYSKKGQQEDNLRNFLRIAAFLARERINA